MGYSTDIFASEPAESLTCAICHDVLKDACSLNCGHTFCGHCIDSYRSSSSNPSCPNCRVKVTSSNPNYVVREVIGALAVKQCPDCKWTGQLKDCESHENTCAFKIVSCDVEGCNHTCQRKDMADHTSNTVVMIRHMELKHDRKLKEMEEKYERKFAQQEAETVMKFLDVMTEMEKKHKDAMREMEEKFAQQIVKTQQLKGEMQNKLQAYERRIRALESRKRSAEDMSNNDPDTPDEMVVEGCGIDAINGTYRREGTHENAPMYVHSARYEGQDEVFTLYRYSDDAWFISIVPEGHRPGTQRDRDFYYVGINDPLPPRTVWMSNVYGVDPPPTVRAS